MDVGRALGDDGWMNERPEKLTVIVTEDPQRSGFIGTLEDGTYVGGAYYAVRGDIKVFNHTEVDPAYEGRGIGGQLAQAAMEGVRAAGGKLIPTCPFIVAYLDKHPQYDDLLARPTNLGSRTAG
jgi:predicted GNAT family acetyltransferase